MSKSYAKALTKDYLVKIGITGITEDGKHVFIKNQEVRQYLLRSGYLGFLAYDPEVFKILYPVTKKRNEGELLIPVHRAVYAWYYGSTEDKVVDHLNNCKTDNRKDNLQLLTPGENIWKDRMCNVKEIKCRLTVDRSFYEEKLTKYLKEYEIAKKLCQSDKAHKLRCNIANTKGRLRYYDSHRSSK